MLCGLPPLQTKNNQQAGAAKNPNDQQQIERQGGIGPCREFAIACDSDRSNAELQYCLPLMVFGKANVGGRITVNLTHFIMAEIIQLAWLVDLISKRIIAYGLCGTRGRSQYFLLKKRRCWRSSQQLWRGHHAQDRAALKRCGVSWAPSSSLSGRC